MFRDRSRLSEEEYQQEVTHIHSLMKEKIRQLEFNPVNVFDYATIVFAKHYLNGCALALAGKELKYPFITLSYYYDMGVARAAFQLGEEAIELEEKYKYQVLAAKHWKQAISFCREEETSMAMEFPFTLFKKTLERIIAYNTTEKVQKIQQKIRECKTEEELKNLPQYKEVLKQSLNEITAATASLRMVNSQFETPEKDFSFLTLEAINQRLLAYQEKLYRHTLVLVDYLKAKEFRQAHLYQTGLLLNVDALFNAIPRLVVLPGYEDVTWQEQLEDLHNLLKKKIATLGRSLPLGNSEFATLTAFAYFAEASQNFAEEKFSDDLIRVMNEVLCERSTQFLNVDHALGLRLGAKMLALFKLTPDHHASEIKKYTESYQNNVKQRFNFICDASQSSKVDKKAIYLAEFAKFEKSVEESILQVINPILATSLHTPLPALLKLSLLFKKRVKDYQKKILVQIQSHMDKIIAAEGVRASLLIDMKRTLDNEASAYFLKALLLKQGQGILPTLPLEIKNTPFIHPSSELTIQKWLAFSASICEAKTDMEKFTHFKVMIKEISNGVTDKVTCILFARLGVQSLGSSKKYDLPLSKLHYLKRLFPLLVNKFNYLLESQLYFMNNDSLLCVDQVKRFFLLKNIEANFVAYFSEDSSKSSRQYWEALGMIEAFYVKFKFCGSDEHLKKVELGKTAFAVLNHIRDVRERNRLPLTLSYIKLIEMLAYFGRSLIPDEKSTGAPGFELKLSEKIAGTIIKMYNLFLIEAPKFLVSENSLSTRDQLRLFSSKLMTHSEKIALQLAYIQVLFTAPEEDVSKPRATLSLTQMLAQASNEHQAFIKPIVDAIGRVVRLIQDGYLEEAYCGLFNFFHLYELGHLFVIDLMSILIQSCHGNEKTMAQMDKYFLLSTPIETQERKKPEDPSIFPESHARRLYDALYAQESMESKITAFHNFICDNNYLINEIILPSQLAITELDETKAPARMIHPHALVTFQSLNKLIKEKFKTLPLRYPYYASAQEFVLLDELKYCFIDCYNDDIFHHELLEAKESQPSSYRYALALLNALYELFKSYENHENLEKLSYCKKLRYIFSLPAGMRVLNKVDSLSFVEMLSFEGCSLFKKSHKREEDWLYIKDILENIAVLISHHSSENKDDFTITLHHQMTEFIKGVRAHADELLSYLSPSLLNRCVNELSGWIEENVPSKTKPKYNSLITLKKLAKTKHEENVQDFTKIRENLYLILEDMEKGKVENAFNHLRSFYRRNVISNYFIVDYVYLLLQSRFQDPAHFIKFENYLKESLHKESKNEIPHGESKDEKVITPLINRPSNKQIKRAQAFFKEYKRIEAAGDAFVQYRSSELPSSLLLNEFLRLTALFSVTKVPEYLSSFQPRVHRIKNPAKTHEKNVKKIFKNLEKLSYEGEQFFETVREKQCIASQQQEMADRWLLKIKREEQSYFKVILAPFLNPSHLDALQNFLWVTQSEVIGSIATLLKLRSFSHSEIEPRDLDAKTVLNSSYKGRRLKDAFDQLRSVTSENKDEKIHLKMMDNTKKHFTQIEAHFESSAYCLKLDLVAQKDNYVVTFNPSAFSRVEYKVWSNGRLVETERSLADKDVQRCFSTRTFIVDFDPSKNIHHGLLRALQDCARAKKIGFNYKNDSVLKTILNPTWLSHYLNKAKDCFVELNKLVVKENFDMELFSPALSALVYVLYNRIPLLACYYANPNDFTRVLLSIIQEDQMARVAKQEKKTEIKSVSTAAPLLTLSTFDHSKELHFKLLNYLKMTIQKSFPQMTYSELTRLTELFQKARSHQKEREEVSASITFFKSASSHEICPIFLEKSFS